MNCPACQADNREAAKFCDNCGQPLARACPACQAANRPGAKFCDECGAGLQAAPAPTRPLGYTPRHLADKILRSRMAMEGERKMVTVLFCDLAGFTSLSARLDPEELHHVMNGFFDRIAESVHIYEGTINQFTGDGVMALFGAPIAHEDHAVRAVAASMAIQKALAVYSEELRHELGLELKLRIGLNTGTVVVGRIGDDLRMDYTAQGETVNVAARLQASAEPGEVLVSQATQSRIQSHFTVMCLGALSLKGVPEPVETYVVAGERAGTSRFDAAIEEGLTPFVGRGPEIETALEALADRRAILSLVAEAGGGKSRLWHELRHRFQADWRVAQCHAHRPEPLELAAQLVRDLSQDARAPDWAAPYLKPLLGQHAPELEGDGLDPVQRKWRTLEAVTALVAARAEQTPLVLVLEDLQWIDPGSQELLETMFKSPPCRVICTYRPEFKPTWQSDLVLPIPPLERFHVAEMACHLGADARSERLLDRAQGNPLFVEELIRYLKEQSGEGSLPGTIQDLLTARLDRLPEDLKETVQSASVVGAELSFPLLNALMSEDRDLAADLDELCHQGILQQVALFPEATYRFTHPLLQEAAYHGMLKSSRSELHARVAEALEQLHPDEALNELAEHYSRAGRREKAREYHLRAGDRAMSLFAYEQAERHFREAGASEKVGDACVAQGRLSDALHAWGEALQAHPVPELHRKMAEACWAAGQKEEALSHLTTGLERLGADRENPEAARLAHAKARIYCRLGRHHESVEWAQKALELGRKLELPEVVASACNALGVAFSRAGAHEEGAAWVEQGLATALEHGLAGVACRAYTNLAVMYATYDQTRAFEYCEKGMALAEKIGDLLQKSWLHCAMAGGTCTISGDFDAGIRAAEQAVELDRRLGQRSHLPIPLIILAQIYQCRGDYETSGRYYREALAEAESMGEPQHLFPCYDGLAILAIDQGKEEEADDWLRKSAEVQQSAGWTGTALLAVPFLY